ncbi:MAG: aspartate--tRNA ligase [Candidatus Phytoplasma stylosanthis]|uniref:aspartate--tRNA ligase n=1 Tax=Candidatus Phytoplasma stylosanthis TaxID=2798314 RepID=UPI00293B74D0|nr:aspartate--tRNA ligase [Candidatus Phytoplasma stylosanthis]MDV3167927.1 aspartate--tRNA ligase [Candidatus Phytoplasma stylosanthis]MDV3170762.1 aspartate--tRNA ligase [Candidatus Phytoplasma stylosanthis]MDV3173755.1 aspartate--tRNA ligase [Candidatus Phytoplasma stylosanthis]MDV3174020.1 aspartate--tRNA ligase [Candidatus Phytoplasma stylosanthis]MDV3202569.1 aspartate--tRNA ligase [Candidatus Phytoplasma stylosanthis]
MQTKYILWNNEITLKNKGQKVLIKGWINSKRNIGGKIFLNLRDFSGLVQLVIDKKNPHYSKIAYLKLESVIEITGIVIERINKNFNLKTGEIEILVQYINILSEAQLLPLNVCGGPESLEEHRLKYRYLDLRNEKKKQYLVQRHAITQNIRETLLKNNFLELETPILSKSTPEGARDYLVPSRIHPFHFYALPQSPQIFKQLYMISGFERYFQIARCFRDEDLRSDRQPEFTQIDIETSFFSQEEIMILTEEIMENLFQIILKKDLKRPFFKITYEKALNLYGTDKPDLRFDLLLQDLNFYFHFSVLVKNNIKQKIKGIKINTQIYKIAFSRKEIDEYKKIIKDIFSVDLHYIQKKDFCIKGFLSQFVIDSSFLAENEICFFIIFDELSKNNDHFLRALGFLRNQLAKKLNLYNSTKESFLWVVDFPLFEFNESEGRYYSIHHPFTAPVDINQLYQEPEKTKSQSYDLIWNGYEIGGGSLRNFQYHVQEFIFEKLGLKKKEIDDNFGFLIEALKYGAPPHGGIALGLDRLVMLFTKTNNIRDVIGFPKNQKGQDIMIKSPSLVEKKQLSLLKLKILKDNNL